MASSDWLNWLTLALVVVTAFYAWATLRILRTNEAMVAAMRAQQNAAIRPYVAITPHVRTGVQLISLKIKNVGKSAACGLHLQIDRDFFQLGARDTSRNLKNHPAFAAPIQSLAPDAELLFALDTGPHMFGTSNSEELCPPVFTITARYSTGFEDVNETTVVDLRPYRGTDVPHDAVAGEIEKLREQLGRLVRVVESSQRTHSISQDLAGG